MSDLNFNYRMASLCQKLSDYYKEPVLYNTHIFLFANRHNQDSRIAMYKSWNKTICFYEALPLELAIEITKFFKEEWKLNGQN